MPTHSIPTGLTVDLPARLCRVGRDSRAVAFSYITSDVDAKNDRGYGFDVLGAGVTIAEW